MLKEKCDLCDNLVEEIYSLCDECGVNVEYWDEEEDIYIMKDGSKYGFSFREQGYILLVNS